MTPDLTTFDMYDNNSPIKWNCPSVDFYHQGAYCNCAGIKSQQGCKGRTMTDRLILLTKDLEQKKFSLPPIKINFFVVWSD